MKKHNITVKRRKKKVGFSRNVNCKKLVLFSLVYLLQVESVSNMFEMDHLACEGGVLFLANRVLKAKIWRLTDVS